MEYLGVVTITTTTQLERELSRNPNKLVSSFSLEFFFYFYVKFTYLCLSNFPISLPTSKDCAGVHGAVVRAKQGHEDPV